ncbi:MAG TPA: hypothetical protein VIT92_10035 [Burkholderiaceae bacterium]
MGLPLEIHGSLLQGLVGASHSLNVLLHDTAREYDPAAWYPLAELTDTVATLERYRRPGHILPRLGMEMMRLWYDMGPGRQLVSDGLDYLRFQSGSQGIHSVIRGTAASIGRFELLDLSEQAGTATIYSDTPFPKPLELGVLLGGLSIGDLLAYYEAEYEPAAHLFRIRFVTDANRGTLRWQSGTPLSLAEWRLRLSYRLHTIQDEFWRAIHEKMHETPNPG